MGALENFLDKNDQPFDVSLIISPEVEEMDSAIPPSSLYKYFSVARSAFFSDPVIRFTQKTSLNDPFELSKRWAEFAGAEVRTLFANHVRSQMEQLGSNKGLVLALIKEEFANNGVFLSPDQIAEVACKLLSRKGSQSYDQLISNTLRQIDQFVEHAFCYMNSGADEAFNKLTSDIGIFSLSENPSNEQMWGLYASSGRGFVVEFNSDKEFFKAPNGRSLIRKVSYTNDRAKDFFANPLALFQVKGEKWSFEQEWRMLKKLSECDEKRLHGQEPIYVCRLKPGMMRSVTFGYNYSEPELITHGAKLRMFDPELHIQYAFVNPARGEIEVRELL